MNAGAAQRRAGNLPAALRHFRGAHAIMHVPSTGAEVAKTLASLGRWVEARSIALEVQRMPLRPDEPVPFTRARAEAVALANDLAKRIPSLVVAVQGAEPSELHITIDADSVPPASLGLPRKLNPGRHRIAATAPGYQPIMRELVLRERETTRATLVLHRQPAVEPNSAARTVGWSALALGAAGFAVWAVAGGLALGQKSSLTEHCPAQQCAPRWYDDRDRYQALRTASTVGFWIGLTAAGVGSALLLSQHGHAAAASGLVRPAHGHAAASSDLVRSTRHNLRF